MDTSRLTPEGREELALALLLLKDFKTKGEWDPELTAQILRFAEALGILKEFNDLINKLPRMRIEPY